MILSILFSRTTIESAWHILLLTSYIYITNSKNEIMKNKILFVLSLLFGLMMINSGLNKFFYYMPMPEMTEEQIMVFESFVHIQWILPLVAFTEILGGLLIAIPKVRALGAIVIFPVMIGIIMHNITHSPEMILIPLIMLLINLWAIIDNKDKYLTMIK